MKRVAVFGSIAQFENFVNDPKVSVIEVKVSTCEQSYNFQECFVGVVFYEDASQNTVELAATDNQQLKAKISTLIAEIYGNKPADRVYSREEVISYLKRVETSAV